MELKQVYDNELEERTRSLCAEFLGGCWKKTEDVSLHQVMGGVSNTMYLVALPDSISSSDLVDNEPRQVLIRFFGSKYLTKDNPYKPMSEAAEDVVFYALSILNLGPKLLGVFPGGRIEQYIPSSRVTVHDFEDPHISQTFGRKIGFIHSLNMPVSKNLRRMFEDMIEPAFEKIKTLNKEQFLGALGPQDKEDAEYILAPDYFKEMAWAREVLPKMRSRLLFCHNDLNMANVLLRDEDTENPDDKVVIIDIEHCSFNTRGWDIATHFCYRCFNFTDLENPISGHKYPTEANRLLLVTEYIKYWRSLVDQSLLDDDIDNAEHVLMEVDFYALYVNLINTLSFFSFFGRESDKANDHVNMDAFKKFPFFKYAKRRLEMYFEEKEKFLIKHPEYN